MLPIYLVYNASKPVEPRVATVMQRYVRDAYGNPSSLHWAGVPARQAVEHARAQVAGLLGATPDEIVFTSGGSEANNLALTGVLFARGVAGAHVVTSTVEHPAIVEPLRFLQRLGATITALPVDITGRIDPNDLRRAIIPATALVTIMHANNEVGTVQPIAECAAIARDGGTFPHGCRAECGQYPTDVDALGVTC